MNEDQIVLSLLNFYKQEGIDLFAILDDPIFKKLPLSTKIQAIKTHAQEIEEGTSQGISKRDVRAIGSSALWHGLMGGLTGATAAAATAKLFTGGRVPLSALVLATAPGFGFGAALGIRKQMGLIRNRDSMRNHFASIAENPTDHNALTAMVRRELQGHQEPSEFNKFLNQIGDMSVGRSKAVATQETMAHNILANLPRK